MSGAAAEPAAADPPAAAIRPEDWAAALLAVDPGLGGLALRARASPAREAFVTAALSLTGRPARRLPPGAADERLFGGLDLAATLAAGRPVHAAGLLADLGAGTLVIPMAERLGPARAARLAQAWDAGAAFSVLALDEAAEPDEAPPPALLDRLAFHVQVEPRALRDTPAPLSAFDPAAVAAARGRLSAVTDPDDRAADLAAVAAELGIASLRAPRLALRAARAAAALAGAGTIDEDAARLAAALVLAPRATRLPPEDTPEPPEAEPPPPTDAPPDDTPDDAGEAQGESPPPEDLLLEAARAAIPPDLLARLAAGGALRRRAAAPGAGAGEDQWGKGRGRPAGVRPGDPRGGARLDLVATLRTAAPWQALRRQAHPEAGRVLVTPEDFRVRRYRQKREKVVIFVVDASGSAAATRLAETKGAIELMLAEAYVRREQVALIAFRGAGAEVLLPPTRSLVQAKRRLAALPGGGPTPLAHGLEAALELAAQVGRKGQTAHLALLTDGRANIARDGAQGRAQAGHDAEAAARAIAAAGIPALLLDTAPRPQEAARALAQAARATYLALPRAEARALAGTLQSALDAPAGA